MVRGEHVDFVSALLKGFGYALAAQIESACMMRREEISKNENLHMPYR